ncbi:putative 2-aminoethylphosphonate ABC transporter permease subunit [Clostridium sp. ZS1]|uniref:putative 2-aminoethylphosphonate ABC transporter permease subunit n=1 Tax=Clostridium sp. ZS1 TaxID=2949989 RepID=UPI00207AADAC|nr:putative 2-aminoethylphosphonate ABC transporter permease subunit [Clostridium sp. ZS1]
MKIKYKLDFSKYILVIAIILFLAISLIAPLITLFIKAFYRNNIFIGLDNFKTYFTTASLMSSFKNSIFISIISTIISMILAFSFCYGIERTNIKFKKIFRIIALIPMFAPTMTYGIALIYIFGNKGISRKIFNVTIPIYGKWGIILAEIIYIFPILFLIFSVAFKMIDKRLYEVAETLGASNIKQFFTVTLPSVKFSIISGFFTGLTMVFTDFGIPKVIGGNYNVLSTDIYKHVIGQQNITMGATAGIILIMPSIISFTINQMTKTNATTTYSKSANNNLKRNKTRDIVFTIFNIFVTFIMIGIFITIFLAAFLKSWPYDLRITSEWFKFSNFGISTLHMYINTIIVAFCTSIIGTIIIVFTAYFVERENKFIVIRKVVYAISLIPISLPGLAIGLAFILFYNNNINPFNFMYGTFSILILINIIHFFSVPFLLIMDSFKKVNKDFENISQLSKMPWYELLIKVIMPISKSAVIESFCYYFINSMVTVSAVVFLYTSKTMIFPIVMINKYDTGDIASTAAISVMIILTNVIFKIICNSIFKTKNTV